MKKIQGFTLVEMLIVISVIIILAGIGISIAGGMMAKAERNASAALQLKVLAACEKYHADNMRYPNEPIRKKGSSGSGDEWFGQVNDRENNLKGFLVTKYLDDSDLSETYLEGNSILDYWGKKLAYWLRNPDASNYKSKVTPELWSVGADGAATCLLKVSAYPDINTGKCNSNHANDTDNVGGDMQSFRK